MGNGKDKVKQKENKKKDAKALHLIQQAVDRPILNRIAEIETTHKVQKIIKKQYLGSSNMITVRKQVPRQLWDIEDGGQ